jgi:hypothetical protein
MNSIPFFIEEDIEIERNNIYFFSAYKKSSENN